MKNTIVVFTFSPFPCGDANANRLLAYSMSMQDVGYKVIVLTNTAVRECDYNIENGNYSFKGVEYRSYYTPNVNRLKRVINRTNIVKIFNDTLSDDEQKKVCLCCTTYRNYGFLLHFFLKKKGIAAAVDVSEWHSRSQFKLGVLNYKYIWHCLKNRFLVPAAKNVICISRYLESFYKKCGCNTLYLPPQIVKEDYIANSLSKLSPIRFFYAGSMQKKDYIWMALDGFLLLTDEERKTVHFTIAGCSEKEFQEKVTRGDIFLERMNKSLNVIGRITKEEVQQYLSKSHFLVLMRPESRYATAGFPSKVPEALAAGVPVVTNLTSDLQDFISDMENGIVVEEFSAQAFATAVRKAITLDDDKFCSMSGSAYKCAEECFDYRVYNENLKKYIAGICS